MLLEDIKAVASGGEVKAIWLANPAGPDSMVVVIGAGVPALGGGS
jgi:hypothetical protein